MIIGLDKKFKAKEQTVFEELPEGIYTFVVDSIKPWEKKTIKNAKLTVRDENGYPLKDDKNKIIKETVDSLEFYVCNVTLKVLDGKYAGRLVWADLTTHPDAAFITEGFLYAVGEAELMASEIPTKCVGKVLKAETYHNKYEKKITDKDTGLETTETRINTKVKRFIKPDLIEGEIEGL